MQGHYVYIVQCRDGSLYTGYAQDVPQRIAAHNAGIGAKYTRGRGPVVLLACWLCESRREALRAEYAIKRLSRVQKWRLIEGRLPLPQAILATRCR
ncbi:MAG TPA: GIY-YIG nuclease family protein [Ktedonobacteraceae bacterium]|nr:GIY-YIG nuclease family protein [Ktedonobacteraceae bacterium]